MTIAAATLRSFLPKHLQTSTQAQPLLFHSLPLTFWSYSLFFSARSSLVLFSSFDSCPQSPDLHRYQVPQLSMTGSPSKRIRKIKRLRILTLLCLSVTQTKFSAWESGLPGVRANVFAHLLHYLYRGNGMIVCKNPKPYEPLTEGSGVHVFTLSDVPTVTDMVMRWHTQIHTVILKAWARLSVACFVPSTQY